MSNTRLDYIDVTKGILIICLIFHHIISIANGKIPLGNVSYISHVDIFFVPYFMQAFFFITGYCSSFNNKAKDFVYKNAKSLLIPLVSFSIINQFVAWLVNGDNFFFVTVLGKRFFFITELYWFLSALFIAKMILFVITKYTSKPMAQFILVLIPFVVAISLNTSHFHAYNFFHWHNGLVNLMFLWAGYTFKRQGLLCEKLGKYGIAALALYLIGLIFCVIFGKNIPYYTHFPHFNFKYTPLFVYFSLTGTIMALFIGKMIHNNKVLSFLGKNTIVVYGIHFSILNIVLLFLSSLFIPRTHAEGLVFYLITGVATLLLSYFFCLLFQKKPFTYLIGKF